MKDRLIKSRLLSCKVVNRSLWNTMALWLICDEKLEKIYSNKVNEIYQIGMAYSFCILFNQTFEKLSSFERKIEWLRFKIYYFGKKSFYILWWPFDNEFYCFLLFWYTNFMFYCLIFSLFFLTNCSFYLPSIWYIFVFVGEITTSLEQ